MYPGMAVLDAFTELCAARKYAAQVVWIGSRRGMERDILEKNGIPYIGIPSGKLRRYFSLSNLLDVFKVIAGMAIAFILMLRHRPSAVFSKGGGFCPDTVS